MSGNNGKLERAAARVEIGKQLKVLRDDSGLIIREIAAALNCGEMTILNREAGRVGVYAEELLAYERLFKLKPGTILRRTAMNLTETQQGSI